MDNLDYYDTTQAFNEAVKECRRINLANSFADPGHSSSQEESEEFLEYVTQEEKRIRNLVIRTKENHAIVWLAKEINGQSTSIRSILERIRSGEDLYTEKIRLKALGEKRLLHSPYRFLKKLQKKICSYLSSNLPVDPNVFGFSGGNTKKAIRPHLKNKCLLCVDCRDAFPSITKNNVANFLTGKRDATYNVYSGFTKILRYGDFSWYTAKIIAELLTRHNSLPQGAPSSPKLFDIICRKMDEKLSVLAKNVGGAYTRYADNIFFSLPENEFPASIRHAILKIVEGRRRPFGPNFKWHKLRTVNQEKRPVRVLGFNIIDGKIHNTRDYKRSVRKRIYHVNWVIDQSMDYLPAWQKLHGLISYAAMETWPESLRNNYKKLRKRVKQIQKEKRRNIRKT